MRSKHTPSPIFAGNRAVALLESRQLQGEESVSYLSADERAIYECLRDRKRREEWLAGRLASKYLFLSQLEIPPASRRQQCSPILSTLYTRDLNAFSPWMYRRIEVLPTETARRSRPMLVWCGEVRRECISLSHTAGLACACISSRGSVAVDLERALPRVDAFYRNTFSTEERAWVARAGRRDMKFAEWWFTLLWTLKESALKLSSSNRTTLWNLPRITIEDLPKHDGGVPFGRSATIGSSFMLFTARVAQLCGVVPILAAVTGTRDLILTVMNPLSGEAN